MQKTMYAIVEKDSRKIIYYDWDGYEILRPLLDEQEQEMKSVLHNFTMDNIIQFLHAEVVPVTLTWE
jgi:hypothetical protein